MINEILYYRAPGYEPWQNQAYEAFFTEIARPSRLIFYLWQNAHTVVIGRNQSAYGECLVDELSADGGRLARRLSGGGAVYHDKENINFTFALHRTDYDLAKQTEVILEAVRSLGLKAGRSGRNDLTIDGKKFSGHSYYKNKDCCFHHGTLLVDTNTAAMQHFLTVTPEKLEANKVRSVRSRVVNLRELLPALQMDELVAALLQALTKIYGCEVKPFPEELFDRARLDYWQRFFSAEDWRLGRRQEGAVRLSRRFAWGSFRLSFDRKNGRMENVSLFSDGLEASWLRELADALAGAPCRPDAVAAILASAPEAEESGLRSAAMKEDILSLFADSAEA